MVCCEVDHRLTPAEKFIRAPETYSRFLSLGIETGRSIFSGLDLEGEGPLADMKVLGDRVQETS